LVDHVLECVFLCLNAIGIVPGQRVARDEAAQNVVRADDADHAEGEECEGNAKGEERLVVNEAAVSLIPVLSTHLRFCAN
jgi:hypothetical protein